MSRAAVVALVVAPLLAGCTADPEGEARPSSSPSTSTASPTPSPSPTTSASTPSPTATPATGTFDRGNALRTIRTLTRIGPREATSGAFREASDHVARVLTDLGYDVTRQRFDVPAGTSWGVPVDAGRTQNVVAHTPDLAPGTPYVLLGAHLDTVPQSPGAEDNASGIAVILELARLAAQHDDPLPLVFVAFGAEEPRGPADDEHHFGSQAYVRDPGLDDLAAMVSLDRVGAGRRVPVCTGGISPRGVQRDILDVAEQVGVRAEPCDNRTSDHWPFEKAGATVARIGGNPSAGYHSPRDRVSNVDPRQVERSGTLVWEWLTTR